MSDMFSLPETIQEYHGNATLLMIEIVGLEILGERYRLKTLFEKIHLLNEQVIEALKARRGIVGGHLRSGLECMFGWESRHSDRPKYHAFEALDCGIHLQRINGKVLRYSSDRKDPLLFLRMSVQTNYFKICRSSRDAETLYGVLSPSIKSGRQLLHACAPNAVLYSQETADFLEPKPDYFQEDEVKVIRIPGTSKTIQGYQHDALKYDPALKDFLLEAVQKLDQRKREIERWNCEQDNRIHIAISKGQCHLINFSRGGFAMRSKLVFDIGATMSLAYRFSESELELGLNQMGLPVFQCEVRWIREEAGENRLYGLRYRNLTELQKENLLRYLLKHLKVSQVNK